MMLCRTVVCAILWTGFTLLQCVSQVKGREGEVVQVTAVLRDRAELPCDLTAPPGDEVYLVLWYKDESGITIYSLDVRGQTLETASHLPAESLGNRVYFRVDPPRSFLTLEPVKHRDEGEYRCRVDYKKSRTKNYKVNLTIIVPPDEVFIVDETSQEIPSVLNANEGAKLILTCEAKGGRPTPRVTWWRGSALMDDTAEVEMMNNKVRNTLIIPQLTRQDLNMTLTCQASNTNLTQPASKTITLDLNLHPLDVRILGSRDPFSSKKHYELACQTNGSRPRPDITWIKNSKKLKVDRGRSIQEPFSNTTISTLSFIPSADDNGKYITCRVENRNISGSVREDSFKLEVHYTPTATLELASTLKKDNLKEGDDVYFECTIRANPRAYKVDWKFEGRFLEQNITAKIRIINQSLVLQSVRRTSAGSYTCVAKNVEGDGESNSVMLKIKHVPVCRPGQKLTYGVARFETAKISCEVDSNPTPSSFKWAFNNSLEFLDVAQSKFTSGGVRSTLSYTPRTEYDYGVLHCWSRNDLGEQSEPCRYTIIAAGPPETLNSCFIQNQTEDALHVECNEGFDGGMPQYFVMEVYDALTHQLKTNITNPVPLFQVNGLEPGTGFMISVYAANAKGRSESLALTASTLRVAERRTGSQNSIFTITPILGVLIGVVAALVLVAMIIVIVMRLRGSDTDEIKKECDTESMEKSHISLKKEPDDFDSTDEKNPDVVPNEDDTVYADVDEKSDQKLNNISNRIYENVPRTSPPPPNENTYENVNNIKNQHSGRPKPANRHEDVTYAELQLPNNQRGPTVVRRITEPTVYAQIDHNRKAPPATQDPDDDELPTAETPLMNNHRESTV